MNVALNLGQRNVLLQWVIIYAKTKTKTKKDRQKESTQTCTNQISKPSNSLFYILHMSLANFLNPTPRIKNSHLSQNREGCKPE